LGRGRIIIMLFKYKGRKQEYMKEYHKEWSFKNSERIGELKYKYRNSENGFLTMLIASLYTPSKIKRRGLIPTSSKEQIKHFFWEYVKKHGRICYYCLEPWTYLSKKYKPGYGRTFGKQKHNLKNLSMDRFDNSKTYSVDNIVFCCSECNISKNSLSIKLIKRLNEIIKDRDL